MPSYVNQTAQMTVTKYLHTLKHARTHTNTRIVTFPVLLESSAHLMQKTQL